MRFSLGLRGGAVLLGAALVALACGSGGASASKGTIVIASDLPTSGKDASSGLPTQKGAQFAIDTLKATLEGKGFAVTFKPYDDAVNGKHDPQKGAQNVQDMIGNSTARRTSATRLRACAQPARTSTSESPPTTPNRVRSCSTSRPRPCT
jgi:hypothetical protein